MFAAPMRARAAVHRATWAAALSAALSAACALSLLAAAPQARAACSTGAAVELTRSGSATKRPGDTLQIDYCYAAGATVDLYAAVQLPDASLLFLAATGSAPAFSASATPFRRSAPAQSGASANLLTLTLPATLPAGTYTFYAVGTAVGGDPMDSSRWLGKALAQTTVTVDPNAPQEPPGGSTRPTSAFFYQTVNPSTSIVRAGATADGSNVLTYGVDVLTAKAANGSTLPDATWSRLSDGRWLATGWTAAGDSRGRGMFLHEASCPKVGASDVVRVLTASSASGCKAGAAPAMSKTSQAFELDGSSYILHQSAGDVYLSRLSDASHGRSSLTNLCMRNTAVTRLADLKWGEATLALSKAQAGNLLLSDVAVARRSDGTWVMFVKGIAANNGCAEASLCELCARAIYRSTSTDLLNWSAPEKVVAQASVPDAATLADGAVWLYFQNFAETCSAADIRRAERAPISAMAEGTGYAMSKPVNVRFSNEAFETNTSLHYPTNGNPVSLPDTAARDALDACMGGTPR